MVLASDEENTSEYSHPPSSQSSTLESNPDVQRAFRDIHDSQKVSKLIVIHLFLYYLKESSLLIVLIYVT